MQGLNGSQVDSHNEMHSLEERLLNLTGIAAARAGNPMCSSPQFFSRHGIAHSVTATISRQHGVIHAAGPRRHDLEVPGH